VKSFGAGVSESVGLGVFYGLVALRTSRVRADILVGLDVRRFIDPS